MKSTPAKPLTWRSTKPGAAIHQQRPQRARRRRSRRRRSRRRPRRACRSTSAASTPSLGRVSIAQPYPGGSPGSERSGCAERSRRGRRRSPPARTWPRPRLSRSGSRCGRRARMPPSPPVQRTQRIVAGGHAVGEPVHAHLALASREAAERRDVGAGAERRAVAALDWLDTATAPPPCSPRVRDHPRSAPASRPNMPPPRPRTGTTAGRRPAGGEGPVRGVAPASAPTT